jgi:hypothetical protein
MVRQQYGHLATSSEEEPRSSRVRIQSKALADFTKRMDDPGAPVAAQPVTGNANLSTFLCDRCFNHDHPPRYEEIRKLNDGLRDRGRRALICLGGTREIAKDRGISLPRNRVGSECIVDCHPRRIRVVAGSTPAGTFPYRNSAKS